MSDILPFDNQDTNINNDQGSQNQLGNQFQTMIKFKMINNAISYLTFNTGNKNIDLFLNTIIQAILFSVVSYLMTNIMYIPKYVKLYLAPYYAYFTQVINNVWYYYFNKPKIFQKKVDIMYITETKQVNELYKAVFWYLSNTCDIDYINEPYLQYTCDQKTLMSGNYDINKIINQHREKKIKYKNTEITYSYYSDIITIYTDKDRKKENYTVTLKVMQHENSNEDILEDFCKYCASEYKFYLTGKVWSQQIYTNKNMEWVPSPSNNYRKLETIILKNNLRNKIKEDIQLFLNSEEWYQHRDIPYTRGYLFHGHPGTGKTSMIKGLSLFSKRHIHYLMLNEVYNDSELLELVKSINFKETILVIEDIDAMLNIVKSRESDKKTYQDYLDEKEKNKKMTVDEWEKFEFKNKTKSTVTLSGLLNVIDGLFSSHGRILIMTTNHPEVLDSALIRPGRIDCKFLFDNCDVEQIGKLFEMFFNQELSETNKIQLERLNTYSNYSPAHITSIFLRYRNNPEIVLDHLDDQDEKFEEVQKPNRIIDCDGDINVPSNNIKTY
jgi:ATP-dependent 26S proteasome regulatory subunit